MSPSVDDGLVFAATHNLQPGQVLQVSRDGERVIFTSAAGSRFSRVTATATASSVRLQHFDRARAFR
ncbi:MAG TPA: hypothetical protein VK466_02325 [Terriglobales bacterium]|nr:hypothetical protein [Terriglobales bacterium]